MTDKDYRGATRNRYEVSCGMCESVVDYRATKRAAIDLANRHWSREGGALPVSVWDRMAVGGVKEVYQA